MSKHTIIPPNEWFNNLRKLFPRIGVFNIDYYDLGAHIYSSKFKFSVSQLTKCCGVYVLNSLIWKEATLVSLTRPELAALVKYVDWFVTDKLTCGLILYTNVAEHPVIEELISIGWSDCTTFFNPNSGNTLKVVYKLINQPKLLG